MMASEKNCASSQNSRDAVCIQTEKVYDICKDKECLEDLRVYFSECDQQIIDRATCVKFRKAEILWVNTDVEPVPFNRGYYSVDLCFFFKVKLEATTGMSKCSYVDGLATYNKKVILFGSEGSAYIFTSNYRPDRADLMEPRRTNLPKAVVELVDPIALNVKLVEKCDCKCCDDDDQQDGCCIAVSDIPESICGLFDGGIVTDGDAKRVYVTIGIFVIVRLQRSIQLLVPCYDYCIPEKECVTTSDDDPCTLFEKIKFPFEEFYPARANGDHHSC